MRTVGVWSSPDGDGLWTSSGLWTSFLKGGVCSHAWDSVIVDLITGKKGLGGGGFGSDPPENLETQPHRTSLGLVWSEQTDDEKQGRDEDVDKIRPSSHTLHYSKQI